MKKVLIVGAGFAGATYARIIADSGIAVEIIDMRDHVAGNAFDFVDKNGIRVHKYGPHLFHTSNKAVFQWLNQFGEWTEYCHKVRAKIGPDKFVPLPINIETINTFFGTSFQTSSEVERHLANVSHKIDNPSSAGAYLNSKIGTELTDRFFRPYTRKMWNMSLEEMDAVVVQRIPIRYDFEDRYFPSDLYQALPKYGYTAIFDEILRHPNISIRLNTAYKYRMNEDYDFIFNSMPIDEYYQYEFGELPYRSIKFHHSDVEVKAQQSWATTNFTDEGPLTRETCWHLLPGHLVKDTGRYTVTSEEPCDYKSNDMQRYYPVKAADGRYDAIYKLYKEKSLRERKISFIGRCGTYQYLDMHQVINQSLMGANSWLKDVNK